MPVEAEDDPEFAADVIVVGSGFGGAVTAPRLAKRGRRVLVLEQGRRHSRAELSHHYATAARMLGRTTAPFSGPTDEYLRVVARTLGAEDTYGPTPMAIWFGDEGVTVPDPFLGGHGPDRTGCRLCGACLIGCAHGSKNTLDLNYLWLAERRGVEIRPEQQATSVTALDEGYEVHLASGERLRAPEVVLAAGCSEPWNCCSGPARTAASRTSPTGSATACARTRRRSPRSSPTMSTPI